ncbi:hypothetical protein GCM10029992_53850 [Glycomyces albus]
MIAKLIAHGPDRSAAIDSASRALAELEIAGVETNQGQLAAALFCEDFIEARHTTATLADVADPRPRIDVLSGGTQTTIQDWPGRVGYWQVGLPRPARWTTAPSGWATWPWATPRGRPDWSASPRDRGCGSAPRRRCA